MTTPSYVEFVNRVNDSLNQEFLQLMASLTRANFDVGQLQKTENSEDSDWLYKWSLQFMGPHLRYKIVVYLKKEPDLDEFVLNYGLFELVGHSWEPVLLPRFDTICAFSSDIDPTHLMQHVKDLELAYVPVYLAGSGFSK